MKNITSLIRAIKVFLLVALLGCSFPCSDQLILKKESPDGRHIAKVMIRDCGATANFATHISLASSSASWSDVSIWVAEGRVPVEIVWHDNESVHVEHEAASIYKKEFEWGGIKFFYAEVGRGAGKSG